MSSGLVDLASGVDLTLVAVVGVVGVVDVVGVVGVLGVGSDGRGLLSSSVSLSRSCCSLVTVARCTAASSAVI